MRVYVDGSTHPVHDDATGLKAVLVLEDGSICEVQIGQVGDALNIIVAGDSDAPDYDARGNLRVYVTPVAKVPA